MFYLKLTFLLLFFFTYSNVQGKSVKKANVNEIQSDDSNWNGKWFPYAPGEPHIIKDIVRAPHHKTENATKTHVKLLKQIDKTNLLLKNGTWSGKWFPYAPGAPHKIIDKVHRKICDDGENDIGMDFDPLVIRYNYKYLCLDSNRSAYEPNLNTQALITEDFVAPAYVAPIKCLNESISYEQQLPTFGAFRPLAAQYGSYKYLPPQRWLRNLAEGAIVMLYHPCAHTGQLANLRKWVQSCLYRHIITPMPLLSSERPFAVLAWGKSLQMSVPEERIVTDFIRQNAKHGPLTNLNIKMNLKPYKAALIAEAHLVTDEQDSEICGYYNSGM